VGIPTTSRHLDAGFNNEFSDSMAHPRTEAAMSTRVFRASSGERVSVNTAAFNLLGSRNDRKFHPLGKEAGLGVEKQERGVYHLCVDTTAIILKLYPDGFPVLCA